jgi:hypothetical protein
MLCLSQQPHNLRLNRQRICSIWCGAAAALQRLEETDIGEFKFLAIERFRGILHRTVKTSLRTNAPIPTWAADKVVEAWNIPNL